MNAVSLSWSPQQDAAIAEVRAWLADPKDEGFFINEKPDIMLTEVHRQARDNPIIRMSMDIRAGHRLTPGEYGESRVVRSREYGRERLARDVLEADQVLCGLNRTRVSYNERVRKLKGLTGLRKSWHPAPGDRLICLRNNKEKAIFNGGLFMAEEVDPLGGKLEILMTSQDEERDPLRGTVFEEFFNGTEASLEWQERRKSLEFTFGWAITCHKSQGSQWDNVLIFDESGAFREASLNWLYTAVTRAAERVTVVL